MSMNKLEKTLFHLIKKEAFFKKKIILSSGKESNYYIDIRKIALTSQGAFLIANLLWEKIKPFKITTIGGPTLGADPILAALAYHAFVEGYKINTFIIRKETKQHGRKQFLEGPVPKKNSKVILIDDVATTGASVIKSLDKIEPYSLKPKACFVVIDREEGAQNNLDKFKLPLFSLFKLSQFI